MFRKIQTVGTVSSFINNEPVGFWDNFWRMFTEPGQVAKETAADKVYDFTAPFFDMVAIAAYPICNTVIMIGALCYIIGFREKTVSWISKASLAYIFCQMLPLLLRTALQMIISY